MKSFLRYCTMAAAASIVSLALKCAGPGNSAEVTYTVTGSLALPAAETAAKTKTYQRMPASGAVVTIRSIDFLPAAAGLQNVNDASGNFADSTFTDGDGAFRFDAIPKGIYIIEGRIDDKKFFALFDSVFVGPDKSGDTVIELEKAMLQPPSAIRGVTGPTADTAAVFVFIRGLETYAKVDSNGIFILKDLPAGNLRLQFLTSRDGEIPIGTMTVTTTVGNESVLDTLYGIRYDGNGNTSGRVPVDGRRYAVNEPATIIGNVGSLEKSGGAFIGWNSSPDGRGAAYPPGDTLLMGTREVLLYAHWTTRSDFTVTYDGGGNTGGTPPVDAERYVTGATVTIRSNQGDLVKTGYVFSGWDTGRNADGIAYAPGDTLLMGDAEVILYARWTAIPVYSVTYSGNGTAGGSVPVDPTGYKTGDTVTVLGNTGNLAPAQSAFTGWNSGTGIHYAPGATFIMGTEPVALFAQWSIIPTCDMNTNTLQTRAQHGGELSADLTVSAGDTVHVAVLINGTGTLVASPVLLILSGPACLETPANNSTLVLSKAGTYTLTGVCSSLINQARITVIGK